MPSKLMMVFVAMDFLFAGCGGLLLGFSLVSEQSLRDTPTVNNVTQNVLLGQCPLTGTTAPIDRKGPWGTRYCSTTVAPIVPRSNGQHSASRVVLTVRSWRGQRNLRLRHIYSLSPGHVPPNKSRLAPHPGLVGRRLRNLYPRSGSRNLGGDVADSSKP
jgi:hypothetical protein